MKRYAPVAKPKTAIEKNSETVWGKVNKLEKLGRSHVNIFRTGDAALNSDEMSQAPKIQSSKYENGVEDKAHNEEER